jgi:hypothetical protein
MVWLWPTIRAEYCMFFFFSNWVVWYVLITLVRTPLGEILTRDFSPKSLFQIISTSESWWFIASQYDTFVLPFFIKPTKWIAKNITYQTLNSQQDKFERRFKQFYTLFCCKFPYFPQCFLCNVIYLFDPGVVGLLLLTSNAFQLNWNIKAFDPRAQCRPEM